MNILITGATGFLGSHLVRGLCKAKHRVVILKRSYSDCWRISDLMPSLTVFNTDQIDLSIAFQEQSIDAVIHTATSYGRGNEPFSDIVESNQTFPLRLLEKAASFQVGTFINTDTFSSAHLTESNLFGYHLSKRHFLEWAKHIARIRQIRVLNVRLEHLYGPHDSDSKFTNYVMKSCLKQVPELLLTPGEQKRDFIYVDDAVSAYLTLLQMSGVSNCSCFGEYELGSGKAVSIRAFVELVKETMRSSTVLRFGALPYRDGEIMFSQANNQTLRNLGWKCNVSLVDGIRSVLDQDGGRWSKDHSPI